LGPRQSGVTLKLDLTIKDDDDEAEVEKFKVFLDEVKPEDFQG